MVTFALVVTFAALIGLGVWHYRAKIERIGRKAGAPTDSVIDFPRKDFA